MSSSAYSIPGNEMWTQWDGAASISVLTEREKLTVRNLLVPFVHVGRDDADLIRLALKARETEIELALQAGDVNRAISDTRGVGSVTIGTSVDGTASTTSSSNTHVTHLNTPVNITGLRPDELVDFHVLLSSVDSPNHWEEAFSSLYFTIFFQVMLGCLHICVFLAALAKFKRYYALRLQRPFYAKIPLVCLGFLIASNLERGLYCFLDPMGATHVVPRSYRRVMLSLSVPWTYASTLLLTFFWSEAIGLRSKALNQAQSQPEPDAPVDAKPSRKGSSEHAIEMATIVPASSGKRPHGGLIAVQQQHSGVSMPLVGKVRSPPRKPASKVEMSMCQFNEPFRLQGSGDDGDEFVEDYADRGEAGFAVDEVDAEHFSSAYASPATADMPSTRRDRYLHQTIVQIDAITWAPGSTPASPSGDYRRYDLPMSHPAPQSQRRAATQPAVSMRSTSPSAIPPPPASPPSIPAPMAQKLLVKGLADSSSSSLSASMLSHSKASRFGSLQREPLFLHFDHGSSSSLVDPPSATSSRDAMHVVVHALPQVKSGRSTAAATQQAGAPANRAAYGFLPVADSAGTEATLVAKTGRAKSLVGTRRSKRAVESESETSHQFLRKYQTPFTLSVVFLTLLDLTFSVLDSLYLLDWQLLPVVEVIFAIIGMVVVVMYFAVAVRVLRRFKEEVNARVRAAEYNAAQCRDAELDPPAKEHAPLSQTPDECKKQEPAIHAPLALRPSSPSALGSLAGLVLSSPSPPSYLLADAAEQALTKHTSALIDDIHRAHHERMVRMSQFLIGSGLGLLLFLAVSLASPQLWRTPLQTTLDDPLTTISRDFLLFFALFIVNTCQVCAF